MAGVYGVGGVKKLWISHAWADNSNQSFDYLVQELEETGLEVIYDDVVIPTGQSLWSVIDNTIVWSDIDGLALVVTKASLASHAVQLELDMFVRRLLADYQFPIFGILAEGIDYSEIPSILATRNCVSLESDDWRERIKAGLSGEAATTSRERVHPIFYSIDPLGAVCEFHPRVGSLSSFFVAYDQNEVRGGGASLIGWRAPFSGPRGSAPVSARSFRNAKRINRDGWVIFEVGESLPYGQSAFFEIAPTSTIMRFGGRLATGELKYVEVRRK
ncbi:toll/interleukin-1 receptor domain-containing protein [Jannaschia sp. M317]|uniref:toll/interleukin-1 receptor domain-containing protein n=1 Tax=Jannaschia sp. M317 TaxID=2867011 RepID=UPI0021A7D152|nr:toll/interleukin-1 receptor domain-containing protein [Jannaschia sp. M317]UWQ18642.1 toll/interleukin-1 receptor domain-containing protein [Jannaschia sp. M317]